MGWYNASACKYKYGMHATWQSETNNNLRKHRMRGRQYGIAGKAAIYDASNPYGHTFVS